MLQGGERPAARADERARDHADPEDRHEQREAGRADAQLAGRQQQLADVEEAGEQDHGSRRHDDRPDVPHAPRLGDAAAHGLDDRLARLRAAVAEAVEREARQQQGGHHEGQPVRDEHGFRGGRDHRDGRDGRADGVPEVVERPVERGRRGQPRPVDEARQPGQHRRAEDAGARAGDERQRDGRGEAADEADRDEGRAADQVAHDRARAPRPAVGGRSEERAEEHAREEVGQQYERDGPRRGEALVRQHQKSDVAGPGAERRLCVGEEEEPGAGLLAEEVLERAGHRNRGLGGRTGRKGRGPCLGPRPTSCLYGRYPMEGSPL